MAFCTRYTRYICANRAATEALDQYLLLNQLPIQLDLLDLDKELLVLGRLLLRLMGKLSNHDLELGTPCMNLYLLLPLLW
ncbi:hypothetical protein SUGI_0262270 [Cryptomeria japonica]|nr:hypothetical protein SUGI_0262270 [Cryptomeria japonica]